MLKILISDLSGLRPHTTTLKEWDSTIEIMRPNYQYVKDRFVSLKKRETFKVCPLI